jgi:hypothetical protein
MRLKHILWRVDQTADPRGFETLFVAQLDDDHRVARVPFSNPAHVASLTRDEAILLADRELAAIPDDRLEQIARSAQLIDREQLAEEEANR